MRWKCLFYQLLITAGLGLSYAQGSGDVFPEAQRFELSLKGGFSKDDLDSASFLYYALGAEYRTAPVNYEAMGGGYWQLRFPVRLYHFPGQAGGSWLVDAKLRPELGPPVANFVPNGFVDLGYIYANHDWFAHRDHHNLQALMLGGWFSVPLLAPRRGTFMVSGATALKGAELVRFSCYLDWMVGTHWGLTLHGDNFMRTHEDKTYSYGSFNMGALWRW